MDNNKKEIKKKKKPVKKNLNNANNKEINIKKEIKEKNVVIKESTDDSSGFENFNNAPSKKSSFNLVEVIIIMIITTLFGLLLGSFIGYTKIEGRNVNCSSIRKDMVEFSGIYDDFLNGYYSSVDKDGLMDAAIQGMLTYLNDPYSDYIDKSSASSLDDELNGMFIGIGVEIVSIDGSLPSVVEVFDDSPASKGGILVGDILYKVDGKDITGLSVTEVASLIKTDEKGKKVTITIMRGEEEKNLDIKRDVIELESVSSYYTGINDNEEVAVIKISTFAKNTYSQFRKVYDEAKRRGVSSLIIDVRDNGGGYLSSANDIASMFLDKGLVVYQKDTKGDIEKILCNTNKEIDIPVVILANSNTASSAEVFIAALVDNSKVQVVGNRTYGKGTIQKLHLLSSGAYAKYTIQTWLTPNGNKVDGIGIEPTLNADVLEEYYNNPTFENDNQLQQAIKLLEEQ